MKLVYFTVCILGLVACSSNPSTEKTTTKTTTTTTSETIEPQKEIIAEPLAPTPNQSVDSLTPKQLKQLGKYLKKSSVVAYNQLIEDFRFAKTDTMLEKAYMNAQMVLGKLEEEIQGKNADAYEMMQNLTFLEKTFGIRASCAAECTAFLFEIDHKQFKALAKETLGDADDQFFALKASVQGDQGGFYPGWLVYFERTWDYGGGVTLGDQRMFTFLKKSYAYQQKCKLFTQEINELREETIHNLSHPIYMNTKEKVQKEINQILKANCLTAKEKKIVRETLVRNEKTDLENPVQFNCITENCDWGG
jgi:ribosomal protein S15P/S13E